LFPTHTSIFTNKALEQQVLAHYDLPQPVRCVFFRQGLNDTYLVETADSSQANSSAYLRIYRHNWRSQAQIEAEVAILNECNVAGLPVSAPVPQRDGRFLTPILAAEGTRYAVLFAAAPGQSHINPTPEQSRALGQVTGQMHNLFDSLPTQYDRLAMDVTYFVKRPFANIQNIFGHLPQEMSLLTDVAQTLTTSFTNLSATNVDYGLCHGDLHTGNAHFLDDSPTFFDFDCLGYGYRAYDLATFCWSRLLFEPDEAKQEACWRAFLTGYEAERPLHPTTLALIPLFTLARQLWVMGIHTDEVTVHYGRSWLNDKYVKKHFGFLHKLVNAVS
jgi:Ser/Thr protein kinase RdoA (MazF antagonist)